jgi:hypothetical protein
MSARHLLIHRDDAGSTQAEIVLQRSVEGTLHLSVFGFAA